MAERLLGRRPLRWFLLGISAIAVVAVYFAARPASGSNQWTSIGTVKFTTFTPEWDASVQCVRVTGPMFRHEPNSTTGTCISPSSLRDDGLIQTYQVNDGPVYIYGFTPETALDVTLDGKPLSDHSGRFFFTTKPRGSEVRIGFTRTGESTFHVVEPAIPTNRYPVADS